MRRRPGLLVASALLLVACAVLTACTRSREHAAEHPKVTAAAVPPRLAPVRTTGRGPRPPATGAWTGAWVNSGDLTPTGRVTALADFEQLVGTQLTIAHVFHDWEDSFPAEEDHVFIDQRKLLMISWGGLVDTREVAQGGYDDLIRARAVALRDLHVPILLRFRWEMDRKNLQDSVHSPADYIAAWKHVRGIFTEVGATNAGWVWCPLATGFQDGRAQQYYPGDRQVDWICADVYAGRDMRSFGETMAPFMAWAAQHPRPAVLGEFGVTEGSPGQKAAWFRDARAYVLAYPQLKALVYFSARKESKPSYDFSVDSSPGALEAFRALVAEPRLHAPPPRGLR